MNTVTNALDLPNSMVFTSQPASTSTSSSTSETRSSIHWYSDTASCPSLLLNLLPWLTTYPGPRPSRVYVMVLTTCILSKPRVTPPRWLTIHTDLTQSPYSFTPLISTLTSLLQTCLLHFCAPHKYSSSTSLTQSQQTPTTHLQQGRRQERG